jgi:hypothetical protein
MRSTATARVSTLRILSPAAERSPAQAEAIDRIRADFREMPDLSVTPEQGARLWHMQPSVCRQALAQLSREGFVERLGEKYRRR